MSNRSFGVIALCVFLILMGLVMALNIPVPSIITGVVALIAAGLILLGK